MFVNNLLDRVGIKGYQISESEDNRFSHGLRYHRGESNLASFGAIDNGILTKMGIKSTVLYAEIPLKTLIRSAKKVKTSRTA